MRINTSMVDKLIAEIENKDSQKEEDSKGEDIITGRWTKNEHLLFIKGTSSHTIMLALQKYGKHWSLVKAEIPNRSTSQIRTHAQKFFIKLSYVAPKNMELIAYMQTKPATFFLDLPNHTPSKNPNNHHKRKSSESPVSRKRLGPDPPITKQEADPYDYNNE